MNDILPIVFTVVLVILTAILIVVGIQIVMVLIQVQRTMKRVNGAIDQVETKFNAIAEPLKNISNLANGLQAGAKVFDGFVSWLHSKKEK